MTILLIIFKEWFGRGGYPVARFYSCGTVKGTKFFIDWNNGKETTEVYIFKDGTVKFTDNDVPLRYKDWITKNYRVVFQ